MGMCVYGREVGGRATGAMAPMRYLANDSGYGILSQCLWVIRVRGASCQALCQYTIL